MLQAIIIKINKLEKKIQDAMDTSRDIKDVRECIVDVLHDIVNSLEVVNKKVDAELSNGKVIIIKELIDEEFIQKKII